MPTFICDDCGETFCYNDRAQTASHNANYCKGCHAEWAEDEFDGDVPSFISQRFR